MTVIDWLVNESIKFQSKNSVKGTWHNYAGLWLVSLVTLETKTMCKVNHVSEDVNKLEIWICQQMLFLYFHFWLKVYCDRAKFNDIRKMKGQWRFISMTENWATCCRKTDEGNKWPVHIALLPSLSQQLDNIKQLATTDYLQINNFDGSYFWCSFVPDSINNWTDAKWRQFNSSANVQTDFSRATRLGLIVLSTANLFIYIFACFLQVDICLVNAASNWLELF